MGCNKGTLNGMRVGEEREIIRNVKGQMRRLRARKIKSTGFPQFVWLSNQPA